MNHFAGKRNAQISQGPGSKRARTNPEECKQKAPDDVAPLQRNVKGPPFVKNENPKPLKHIYL